MPTLAQTIRSRIDERIGPSLADYQRRLRRVSRPKIIRDVVWGFNRFQPYEVALIDSPPFQRLRNISQTSLALFTYPCSVHSRFEHCLGAAAVASRMLDPIENRSGERNEVLRLETRLATLLHDLGHGPLSHTSEKFYERLPDADGNPIFGPQGSLALESRSLFANAQASEVLTYFLLTTTSFRDLWKQIVDMYERVEADLSRVSLDRVASMILGVDELVGGEGRFYRQVVNGPFDADKLDYLSRDGYFTGLAIVVDVERLPHTVTVIKKGAETQLGVVASGASVLEQVLFAKTQLFSTMYHHHKVRAAHQMAMHLLRRICVVGHRPRGLDPKDPVSYLFLDDYDLLSYSGNPEIDPIVQKIKNRALPLRALVISYPCFQHPESRENFNRLSEDDLAEVERGVAADLSLESGQIMFDLPDPPRLMGTGQTPVELSPPTSLSEEGVVVPLQVLYPAGAWAAAYAGYRKMAYVFTTADDRLAVGTAVMHALKVPPYAVALNNSALDLAKVR